MYSKYGYLRVKSLTDAQLVNLVLRLNALTDSQLVKEQQITLSKPSSNTYFVSILL
jgi:hypothetical protein